MANTPFTIQFLGTGNAWSKPPINYNTNALVRANEHTWLLDCGLLCPLALRDAGISQSNIDGVFISHLHGDHVLGLEELLYTNYFAYARRIQLWLPNAFLKQYSDFEGTDIWDNCLRASMESFCNSKNRFLKLNDYADVHPIFPQDIADFFGLPCQIFPTLHAGGKPSFGLILDNRVAFTSDVRFSLDFIDSLFERGVQTLFHDVTFAPPSIDNIHTAFHDLATIPPNYAQHIILMHYSDLTTNDDFLRAQDLGFRIARRNDLFSF